MLSLVCLSLANCGSAGKFAAQLDPKYGVATSPRVIEDGEAVPKGGGVFRIGKPYMVAGRTYVPEANPNYRAEGTASWYGRDFHGRLTANGEVFDSDAISAAHPTLPIPSYVRVTNLSNRRSIVVRVNDRGPFHSDRVIDLSARTADLLGFRENGTARVRVEYIGSAPLEGSDDRKLMATLHRDGQPAPAPSTVLVASASPFVPASSRVIPASVRNRQIPNPPDRPFEFGHPSSPTAARERQEMRVAQAAAESRSSYSYPARPVSSTEPIAGYTSAVVSGRGLY